MDRRSCDFVQCAPNQFDLNNNLADGCEYFCTGDINAIDVPDPLGVDANCDGVDGDVDNDARLAAELQASAKNQIEHRVVIDDVHDRLLPWASYLDWEPEPSIVTVANADDAAPSGTARLVIARGTRAGGQTTEAFDVPFEAGQSVLDALRWIRANRDPGLAFRFSHHRISPAKVVIIYQNIFFSKIFCIIK